MSDPSSVPVLWLTGLSGSGKTTIARALCKRWQKERGPCVLLDGDKLREVFDPAFGHERAERRRASLSYARLCRIFSDQGMPVICATISLFHETQAWNRTHIPGYVEVHVRAPREVLKSRDIKSIYSRAERGELKHVFGIDIPAEEPINPDIVIENHGAATVLDAVEQIMKWTEKRFSSNGSASGKLSAQA